MTTPAGRPIGEREFHRWLVSHLSAGRSGSLPLGDDAAAIRPPPGRVAVLTTDALVEGTHFLPDSPAGRVGAAAVSVGLSDLAAKGASPAAVLLALIVPPGTPMRWAEEVSCGAERQARRFGAAVLGGDTKPGLLRAVVGFALGWGRPDRLAPRTGARPGDLLVTTGTVGRGGVAAAHLADRRRSRRQTLGELLDVRPRVREGLGLVQWAHSMLDTSDGLAESARLLSAASGVRVVLEEASLPWARDLVGAGKDPARRRSIAFFGGDYELLAALKPSDLGHARRAVRSLGTPLTQVGRVERGRGAWLETGDGRIPLPPPGWQPFAV